MLRKTFSPLLAAAAVAALVACSEVLPEPRMTKEPQITQVTSLHAVRFAPEGFQVSPAEWDRLVDFLLDLRLREGDRIMVELPMTSDGRDLAGRRALAVMQLLARQGIVAEPFALTEPGGQVLRVGVERVAVNASADCPDWPEARDFGAFVNDALPNFGCASANNFAVMLANPRDAVEGRALSRADVERVTLGLRAYRVGKNLPFEPLPYSEGDE
ncbi:CpaD family pilus assembly lipoprotein [Algihabitans albus]|uniref:CpaD family pilus assembly lipoprotein n=1 Tax=Algihabitans albus TaxID=2164067 RepID=UPI000E5D9A2C|nr:CpaD family pilus assembly lipoprotein [Algihabitans albus]